MSDGNGEFVIYAPPSTRRRLKVVGNAVKRLAAGLDAAVEIHRTGKTFSVNVYYRNGGSEEIPIYTDWGKRGSEGEVHNRMLSLVYALSFHPKYAMLQPVRNWEMGEPSSPTVS